MFASGFLCTSFGSSSGAPEGFRKDSRRIPEENNKKTGNKYEEGKIAWFFPGRNNRIFISQRLCTHSAILPFYTAIFDMLTGFPASGSGVCGERIYFLSSGDATHKLFVDEISNFLKTKFRMYDNTPKLCHRPTIQARSIKPLLPQRR